MTLLKFILALSLSAGSSASFAADPAAVSPRWDDLVCQNSSKQTCLIAKGWVWLRRVNVVIDPALTTAALSSGTYVLGVVARSVVGETPEVVFVLTVSRAGMQTGAVILIGGVAVAIVGTFSSALGFLLATTTKTAPPEQDELLTRACRETIAPYLGSDGLQKLLQLPPEEMQRLLPCLPADKGLSKFLGEVGQNGAALENQIHIN